MDDNHYPTLLYRNTAAAYFLASGDWQVPAPHWFWRRDSGNWYSAEQVHVQADAYAGSQYIGTVHGRNAVTVWSPTYTCGYNARDVTLDVNGAGSVRIGAGSWSQNGIDWTGRVEPAEPVGLFGLAGQGKWSFVQTLLGFRSNTISGATWYCSHNNIMGLDTSYPYAPDNGVLEADDSNLGWPDNFSLHSSGDAPAQLNLPDTVSAVSFSEQFRTYMMYRPADIGNGNQWVPLHRIEWDWYATLSRPGSSWVTASPPYTTTLHAVTVTGDQRWGVHPEWNVVLLAGDPWVQQ